MSCSCCLRCSCLSEDAGCQHCSEKAGDKGKLSRLWKQPAKRGTEQSHPPAVRAKPLPQGDIPLSAPNSCGQPSPEELEGRAGFVPDSCMDSGAWEADLSGV